MYDELVKKIRHCATDPMHCLSCGEDKDGRCFKRLMTQAADAIEDLEFACNRYEKDYKVLCEYLPKWIPVTERLPEQKINQNTLDFEYVLCATTFGDVRPYKFGRRIGQGESHFWNGNGYVDAYITHWMPLPEPPKEE